MLGRWRFLALYLLGALGGSVLGYYLIDPGLTSSPA
jgi:membrane associated rhomboid family serine protease